jgi:hypothetical protein
VRVLRKLVFGISADATRFEQRGFRGGSDDVRRRFDAIGQAFVTGYHTALDVAHPDPLPEHLQSVEHELRGFAYEGAAMALALLDTVMPWGRGRWRSFVAGAGAAHTYMAHIGAGWAVARLGGNADRFKSYDNPALRWLVFDGLGFHEAYFHWPRAIDRQLRPERLAGYSSRAFDQGLGRGLWFVEGAEPFGIARSIAKFAPERRPDLWAGVGLAAAYAGGASREALVELRDAAEARAPEAAQGASFAAHARARAGNPAVHTDLACQILCGVPASEAAQLIESDLEDLRAGNGLPEYEVWRKRIHERFACQTADAHG